MTTEIFAPGGYRFIPGRVPVFGRRRGRARLPHRARDVSQARAAGCRASAASEQIITARGRPLTAFCACELRSPEPFTDEGFRAFNEVYVTTLAKWGTLRRRDEDQSGGPQQRLSRAATSRPSRRFHAFAFTVAAGRPQRSPTFVVAGSGEAQEGGATYRERTVRYGETGPDAMREKARLRAGRDGAAPGTAGLHVERYHAPPRSTPCTTFTRSSPTRS